MKGYFAEVVAIDAKRHILNLQKAIYENLFEIMKIRDEMSVDAEGH